MKERRTQKKPEQGLNCRLIMNESPGKRTVRKEEKYQKKKVNQMHRKEQLPETLCPALFRSGAGGLIPKISWMEVS